MAVRLFKTSLLPEQTAAATPASGSVAFYAKSDHRFYGKGSDGVEFSAFMPVQIAGNVDLLAGLVTQGFRAASANPPLDLGTGTLSSGTTQSQTIIAGSPYTNPGVIKAWGGFGYSNVYVQLTVNGNGVGNDAYVTASSQLNLGVAANLNVLRINNGAIGFYGASPVAQISGSTDLLAGLVTQGLRAASANPALNLGSGALTAGVGTFSWTSTSAVGLTVNGPSGQTGNLQEWKVNGSALASVTKDGYVVSPRIYSDANSWFGESSGNTVLNFDAYSSLTYNRTVGVWALFIGGNEVLGGNSGTIAIISSSVSLGSATNFVLNTTTGTMWGTDPTQKQAWYGAIPVAQISGSTDLLAGLVTQGLRAASANPALNLGTGQLSAGVVSAATGFKYNNAIPTAGHYLRSNGTAFVDGMIEVSDNIKTSFMMMGA